MRYERERPGELLHFDVKKPGRIPPGGGKRYAPGFAAISGGPGYVHVAVDDRSRFACAEALPDERGRPPPPSPGGRSPASPASASGPEVEFAPGRWP